jgi:hypothetical protein
MGKIRMTDVLPAVRRVLLDSNALDPMLTQVGAYEILDQAVKSGELAVFFTHCNQQ